MLMPFFLSIEKPDPDLLLLAQWIPTLIGFFLVTWVGSQIFWNGPEESHLPPAPLFLRRLGHSLIALVLLGALSLFLAFAYRIQTVLWPVTFYGGLSFGELLPLYPMFRLGVFCLQETFLEGANPVQALTQSWQLTRSLKAGFWFPLFLGFTTLLAAYAPTFLFNQVASQLSKNSGATLLFLWQPIGILFSQWIMIFSGLCWTAHYLREKQRS